MELLTQELEWGQDNMNENKQDFNLSKEDFQFVQMNEKIFDKKCKLLYVIFTDLFIKTGITIG